MSLESRLISPGFLLTFFSGTVTGNFGLTLAKLHFRMFKAAGSAQFKLFHPSSFDLV